MATRFQAFQCVRSDGLQSKIWVVVGDDNGEYYSGTKDQCERWIRNVNVYALDKTKVEAIR